MTLCGEGEGQLTLQAVERLAHAAPDRMMWRRRGAFVASLIAHGLVLVALIWLLQQVVPLAPPADPGVAMVFAPAAPIAEPIIGAPEPPPPVELSAPAPPTPVQLAAPEPPPPVELAAPEPPPPVQVAAPVPPPVQQAKPRHAVPARPQVPATARAPVGEMAPAVPAALTAPAVPARPVAGMESDRPPAYPEIARRRGQQGRVMLQVNVSAEGAPVAVSVAESSGYPSLDAAAQAAVQRWRFVPASRAGVPVPAVAQVPVRFRLTD